LIGALGVLEPIEQLRFLLSRDGWRTMDDEPATGETKQNVKIKATTKDRSSTDNLEWGISSHSRARSHSQLTMFN